VSGLTQALQAASGWLALAALLLGLVALVWLVGLHKRVRAVTPDVRRLIRDMEGKDIQQVVQDLLGNMEFLGSRLGRLQVASDELQQRQRATVQNQGLVRYNADGALGGELSFALALLDGERDGVLMTCLHTLEGCRLYIRQVEQGACAHDLSEEEAEALDIALKHRQRERDDARRTRQLRWREKDQARMNREVSTDKRGDGDAE
jgi:hypothetical protein